MSPPTSSRRALLETAGCTLGAVTLAGCGSRANLNDGDEPTVEVGPGNVPTFEPETITVSPGTTVTWVWRSHSHNVVPSAVPENASWDGTPGGAAITYGTDYTYEKTFSVSGRYAYYCEPHLSGGMTGTVTVE